MPMIILGIVVVLLLWLGVMYNSFVRMRYRVKEAWSDIDVQLKRRYNLIPNLVEAVKGYMTHEKGVLENVTKARANAIGNQGDPEAQAKTENMLSGALKTLFAVSENYPDLKANQNFLELQRDLTDTEDKIQAARRFYNGNVRDYNTKTEIFPNTLFAEMFGFHREPFFELDNAAEKEVVAVKFDTAPATPVAPTEAPEKPKAKKKE
ncbi:MAG: LemA family protein [Candidatus Gracilibacteria bacterium]